MSESKRRTAILLVSCVDQPGLVSAVSSFIHEKRGNILTLEQHVDRAEGIFFMRVEWDLSDFELDEEGLRTAFGSYLAKPKGMEWALHFSDDKQRLALFASKEPHCLVDLLARQESGELNVEIPVVIGNHRKLEGIAERFGVDFRHVEVTRENKESAENEQKRILESYEIELIVLARYMQVLSGRFVSWYPNRIINIHHSFLPAFAGARPYHQAYRRGVKVIGATSHYVTDQLDEGPIIEQDVIHVTHRDSVSTLVRRGRDLEKVVLARAVLAHAERRVLVCRNRTVVFD
ncbi:MAG: formyltetrahydrofolate deformylase [Verrucomicrobiota bacterium]